MNIHKEIASELEGQFTEHDPAEIDECRKNLAARYPEYDRLLDVTARLLLDLQRADIALEREAVHFITAKKIIQDDCLDPHVRLEALGKAGQRINEIVSAANNLRKSVVARSGGLATAGLRARQNEAILQKYHAHDELHPLSGDAAANQIFQKYPELTADLGIAYRRVADLIREAKKTM